MEANNLSTNEPTEELIVQRVQSESVLQHEETSPIIRRSRSASGSFRGAYESEEEIHFAGLSRRSRRSNASSMSGKNLFYLCRFI